MTLELPGVSSPLLLVLQTIVFTYSHQYKCSLLTFCFLNNYSTKHAINPDLAHGVIFTDWEVEGEMKGKVRVLMSLFYF